MSDPNQSITFDNNDQAPLRADVAMHRNIKKLEESDIYKSADGPKKLQLQKDFYKRFVIPYNKDFKENVTFFDWAKGRMKPATGGEGTSTLEKIGGGITGGVTSMLAAPYHGVQRLNQEYQQAANTVTGIKNYVNARGFEPLQTPRTDKLPETTIHFEALDKLIESEKHYAETHYDNNLKDTALRTTGEIASQLPAFELTGGVLKKAGLDVLINPELWPKSTALTRLGGRMLYRSAEGYLVGAATDEDPAKTAGGFAIGSELFHQVGARLFSPVTKFVGEQLGLGGQPLVSQLTQYGKDLVENSNVVTKVAPITVALGGSEKQRIGAATVRMLNDMVGGDWGKATNLQKIEAVKKLAKVAPEIGDQLAAVNRSLIQADATVATLRQRQAVPEFNNLLTQFENIDKTPTAKTVADSVSDKATARQMVKNPGQIKVGAAAKDSLEFESSYSKAVDDQLSKLGLGKEKIVFEDRGHKLLFYLNVLLTENKQLGPSKERNKMFNLLLRHLDSRYPGRPLSQLMQMSDKVWTDMENLTKAGHMSDESGPVRYFRQHNLEGQSPFVHELKLVEEAKAKEVVENKFEADAVDKKLRAAQMPVPSPAYDAKLPTEGQKLEKSVADTTSAINKKRIAEGKPIIGPPKGREKRTRVRGPEEQALNAAWAQARKEFGDTKNKLTSATTEQIEARVKEIMASKEPVADKGYKEFPKNFRESNAEIDTLALQQAKRILGANAKSQEITDLSLKLKEDPSRGGTTFAAKIKQLKEKMK